MCKVASAAPVSNCNVWPSTSRADQQLPVGEMLIKCTAVSMPYSRFLHIYFFLTLEI
jgi:hypothetical protein